MTDVKLLILIPAYNEEGAVGSVVKEVRAVLSELIPDVPGAAIIVRGRRV